MDFIEGKLRGGALFFAQIKDPIVLFGRNKSQNLSACPTGGRGALRASTQIFECLTYGGVAAPKIDPMCRQYSTLAVRECKSAVQYADSGPHVQTVQHFGRSGVQKCCTVAGKS